MVFDYSLMKRVPDVDSKGLCFTVIDFLACEGAKLIRFLAEYVTSIVSLSGPDKAQPCRRS